MQKCAKLPVYNMAIMQKKHFTLEINKNYFVQTQRTKKRKKKQPNS